ncbi:MAG: hypothetical protein RL641_229 [Candidatus Parcubacteria bacterium]|jgi:DNA helicase-2/ATP-dependent DNA helicase PcrA
MNEAFTNAYKSLNTAQKQAVDTTEGPVMVVAGPGTGKTQILALRIANILKKTDTQADGILCLTFTNSGVEAMRRRLRTYIGPDAGKINVTTYHAFGTKLIEEFYSVIGLPHVPSALDDTDTLSLFDHILNEHEWTYLRPRSNSAMYYRDLKSLISLLKRERMSPDVFLREVEKEIAMLAKDPTNISSRGETKGQLNKETQNKIEGLERMRETVRFYELYEVEKRERNAMDYDDILSYMTEIVRESEDVRATLRERYLYVLVDEHQDSSGVQNEFLKIIWGDVEAPNIFVVGDDRQLIYGFGGASLSHFEEFVRTFEGTKQITLIENYRSSQTILDTADKLLESVLAKGKLQSNSKHKHPVCLMETMYPRDEILQAGLFFKEKIADGTLPKDCALIVPKNVQVRSAVAILRDMGLPASSTQSLRLFDVAEFDFFITILNILNDPYDTVSIAEAVLDPISGIPPLSAHQFLHEADSRKLSVDSFGGKNGIQSLFAESDPISLFGRKLSKLFDDTSGKSLYSTLQIIGNDFFLETTFDPEAYVKRIEIIRSMIHLANTLEERNPKVSLKDYLLYIERLQEYGENIPLAVFGTNDGIQVMTLHGSKGLEFDAVWIAHMNERALMSGKRMAFTLPESVKERLEKKDQEVAKRELYVAITRAKRFCTLSFAKMSHKGSEEHLAAIIEALPNDALEFMVCEAESLEPIEYVTSRRQENPTITKEVLQKMVAEKYHDTKVSVTLLNAFFECPWKWYFRNFLQVPEPLTESLQFGSIVHGAIERIVKSENQPTKKDIDLAVSEEITKSRITQANVIKKFTKDATAAVTRFADNSFADLWSLRESEKALSCRDSEVPELLITGKIDLLESDDGGSVRVTDFKTGKTKSAKDVEKLDEENRLSDYLRQLAMYSYLIENSQKGRQTVEASRLYFVEENDMRKALYQTTIGEEHIESLRKDISDYDSELKNGTWTERPCYWKSYGGKETECQYCKRAKMYI